MSESVVSIKYYRIQIWTTGVDSLGRNLIGQTATRLGRSGFYLKNLNFLRSTYF